MYRDISLLPNNKLLIQLFSQRVVSDETTQFFALPFTRHDTCLASILSRGRGKLAKVCYSISTGEDSAILLTRSF